MDISVVIPQYGKSHLTIRAISSLIEKCLMGVRQDVEVIVVDDGSPDNSAQDVVDAFPGIVSVIKCEQNRGYAAACNLGASFAAGEKLIMLNNDTITTDDWVTPLCERLDAKNVGIAGSLLLFPDLRVQHAGMGLFSPGPWPILPFNIGFGDSPSNPAYRVAREVDSVTGACFAIRKDLYDQLGGFDEGFTNACEDVDLNLRVRETGRSVWYEPRSVLIHDESSTRKWTMSSDGIRKNLDRLNEKWLDSDMVPIQFFGDRVENLGDPRPTGNLAKVKITGNLYSATQIIEEAKSVIQHGDEVTIVDLSGDRIVRSFISNIVRTSRSMGVTMFIEDINSIENVKTIHEDMVKFRSDNLVIYSSNHVVVN
ncbi:MAG: glycosyltransferase family 2 protein [Actinomycetota bacterium]|nr:glycosyltransferase family 2 protein [Actinomycetota bacterium]